MNSISYSKIPAITSRLICPVSSSMINENTARINGGFTLLMLFIFILTQSIIPVVILALDFSLRAINQSKLSPFTFLSGYVIYLSGVDKKMINAGPKIFAARIGLIFSVIIVVAFLTDSIYTAYTLSALLGLFSLLESVFGICVACEIYTKLYRLFY